MADTKVPLGFQSTPSFFPNKNEDFNYSIKIMIKKRLVSSPNHSLLPDVPNPPDNNTREGAA